MGTDIHIRVERRNPDTKQWEIVKPGPQPCPYEPHKLREDWPTPRNYFFFALVAGVRNGFGFAGVPTHVPLVPISQPRGVPSDMASEFHADDAYPEYEDADADGVSNLGDHSFTWLLLSELQEGVSKSIHVGRTGMVELPTLAKVEHLGDQPSDWSGGIDGQRVRELPFDLAWEMSRVPAVVEAAQKTGLLYVTRYNWTVESVSQIDDQYRRLIFEEWPKLGNPEDVRIIMGFDS